MDSCTTIAVTALARVYHSTALPNAWTYTSGAERAAAPISPYSGGPLSKHGSSGELGLYAYSMRQSPAKSPADDATRSASEA